MNLFNMPNWYIAYTRPLMEKKLAIRFAQKNITHYCPVKTSAPTYSKRQKSPPIPLFTSYVFVYVTPDKHPQLKKMWEVINLVYWLDKPVIIEHSEMDLLKKFLTHYNDVTLEKIPVSNNNFLIDTQNVLNTRNSFVTLQCHSLGFELKARLNHQLITTHGAFAEDKYHQSTLTKFAI